MKRERALAALVMGALTASVFGGVCAFAEDSNTGSATTTLSEVVVIGNRDKEREVLPGDFVYTKSQTGFLNGKKYKGYSFYPDKLY